jgi:hypothetical protein
MKPRRYRPTLPVLPSIVPPPPEQRLINQSAMKASWADPLDDNPNRRVARCVTGYRSFCRLRRMLGNLAVGITELHVIAADRLRLIADIAQIGFLGARDLGMPANAVVHGPRSGPSAAALARARHEHDYNRAMSSFDPEQTALVHAVILRNHSLSAWCRERHVSPARAKAMLIGVLDLLVEHFDEEVRREGVLAI